MNDLDLYILNNIAAESPLLHELDRQTNLRTIQPRMLSGHLQGKLLEMFVRMVSPRYILELGTFTGYSAIAIAAALPEDGLLHTIEIKDELKPIADEFIERSGHRNKIVQHIGSALEIMDKIGLVFDVVFIDADKREYSQYYNMLMDSELVRSGSIILADNVLWSGKVVEPIQANDTHTIELLKFNELVAHDPRVDNVIIPMRDGMNVIRVK